MTSLDLRPVHLRADLFVIPVVRNAEKLSEMQAALTAAAAEFNFEITELRIRGEAGRIPTLYVTLSRPDGVDFEFEIAVPDGIRYIGLYVLGSHLRYAAELSPQMVQMLQEAPTIRASERLGAPLTLPGRS